MAVHNKRNRRRHRRPRYGAAGHQSQRQQPDRNPYRRSRPADLCLCSADRTGIHPAAAGRRHRGSQSKREKARKEMYRYAGNFRKGLQRLPGEENNNKRSSKTTGSQPYDILSEIPKVFVRIRRKRNKKDKNSFK